ncbi:transglycosylase SLT domain-containing protein [bacterium]|nr:transglycosylase SLT domain-containing protein [bacterium]
MKAFVFLLLLLSPFVQAQTPLSAPAPEATTATIPLSHLFIFTNADEANRFLIFTAQKKYPEAMALLGTIKPKLTSPIAQSTLSILLGITAISNHDLPGAEIFFKEALRINPQLSEIAGLMLARTLKLQNRWDEAYKALPAATDLKRKLDNDLFWEKIEILIGLKDATTLATLAVHEKENAKDDDELLKITYYKGLYHLNTNHQKTAFDLWKGLLLKKPASPFEENIFLAVIKSGTPIDEFLNDDEWLLRAKTLVDNGMAYLALPIYARLAPKRPSLDLAYAETAFKSREYVKAAQLYQQLWDHPKPGQNRSEILNKLTSSYGRSDQFDQAIKYNKLRFKMDDKDDSPDAAPGKLAFLFFDKGDYKKAMTAYESLLKKAGGKNFESYLWKHFWCAYLTNDLKKAQSDIVQLEKMAGDKDEKQKVQYWTARVLEQTQKKNEANQIYRHLAQTYPNDYYGILSQKILDAGFNHSLFQITSPSGNIYSPFNRLNFNIQILLNTQDSIVNAILYSQLGLLSYAREESERSTLLNEQAGIDNTPYYLLTQNYSKMHAVGATLVKVNNEPFGNKAWKFSYPRAFQLWVMLEGKERDVHPFLIWALMRQESGFRPGIVSPADAIGLMQIIPQTGRELAKELSDFDFHHDDLKDAYTNIRYGTQYIHDRLTEFKNMPYAIASYNAGPNAVNRWKRWGDKLAHDEFIELIPYTETNNYVKKVLRNYWIYKRLYGK